MKNILEFNSFENENPLDPNAQAAKKKFTLSSNCHKNVWFAHLTRDEKELVKKIKGHPLDGEPTGDASAYKIKTGDEKIPELTVPKEFIYDY